MLHNSQCLPLFFQNEFIHCGRFSELQGKERSWVVLHVTDFGKSVFCKPRSPSLIRDNWLETGLDYMMRYQKFLKKVCFPREFIEQFRLKARNEVQGDGVSIKSSWIGKTYKINTEIVDGASEEERNSRHQPIDPIVQYFFEIDWERRWKRSCWREWGWPQKCCPNFL